MLQIITSADVPDGTYFTSASCEPVLKGDTLTILNGSGSRRSSWGAPGVTSTILVVSESLVTIHVGFHHKHRGGQFYRYYRLTGADWQQVVWAKLADEERAVVLTACQQKAPSWAKVPGKLRAENKKPAPLTTQTTYKLVRIDGDNRLWSVYDDETEYIQGKRLAERAIEDHHGGYYSYPESAQVLRLFHDGTLFPERCYQTVMDLALIECEISGTILEYENGKLASTYLRPVRILQTFNYNPFTLIKEAC